MRPEIAFWEAPQPLSTREERVLALEKALLTAVASEGGAQRVGDPRWVGVVKPEDFVRLMGELMAMLSWAGRLWRHAPARAPPTRLLQRARSCLGTFAARVASICQTTPARAIRFAGRRRETARSRALGRRPVSGRCKPFLLRLRTNVGLGAKEVLGAAPKLARTGARQGARCGGVLLSVRVNDVRRLQQRWISRKTRGKTLMPLLRDLTAK